MRTRVQQLEAEGLIDHTRARDWFDPSQSSARVVMVGCGGIGSPTAVCLSKAGIPYLTLIDDDLIEAHNVPNQFYPYKLVGKKKVAVLKNMCEAFGSSDVQILPTKVEEVADSLHGIVCTGLDSMAARKAVWEIVKDNHRVEWLVCGRLSGLDLQIYTINVHDDDDVKFYEEWALFSDEEADEQPCTQRARADMMMHVGGWMSTTVLDLLCKDTYTQLFTANLNTRQTNTWNTEKPKSPSLDQVTRSTSDIQQQTQLSSTASTTTTVDQI